MTTRAVNLWRKAKIFGRLLAAKAVGDTPYYCHFQVTRRCNFRCVSCCVWREEATGGDLSLADIQTAAVNLYSVGARSVALTGGEPLMRGDIAEIAAIFHKQGFLVRLQTNGFLLKPEITARLIAAGVADVYVSLDTMDPDAFAAINGVSRESFASVRDNAAAAAKALGQNGGALFLTAVMRPDNLDQIGPLRAFAASIGALIGFYGLEVAGESDATNIRHGDPALFPSGEHRLAMRQAFENLAREADTPKSGLSVSGRLLDDYAAYYACERPRMKWPCRAGELYLELFHDGRIGVCNAAPPLEGWNFKNLAQKYAASSRNEEFVGARAACSGCICTRQLEYLAENPLGYAFKTAGALLRGGKG